MTSTEDMARKLAFGQENQVLVPASDVVLEGNLYLPEGAQLLAIFAHGSGSGRLSPRNRYVAGVLNKHCIGTLLIDLLTREEERIDDITRELRFDIPMLADRLIAIADWAEQHPTLDKLKLGFFGASTGGGGALIAAALRPETIAAVVSRGGRPDLAGGFLRRVQAPVLLLVGENDEAVIDLNRQALSQLNKKSRMVVIPHASHLFEEPGTLEEVARQAAGWFSAATQSAPEQPKEPGKKKAE
jgi:putative phosphoribosyl transferase